ncbi:MAG: GntR family transcriptional regulator [Chloroflexi bacterium]|nr:GntR family transcriptional regulator [Chloroflexota bacterium]
MKAPLPRASGHRVLADWIAESLRLAILQGHFEPGEKLDQDLIATEYEVSRTPVREAVRVLESEGFVQVRPHRGAFIATISQDDIQEIYEVRKLIEAEIVRQVTLLIPDSVLDELEESLDENRVQLESDDKVGHVANDIFFHDTIVQFVENKLLGEILASLTNRTVRVRRFAQLQPGFHLVESLEEHRAVFRAMRRRDAKAAAEAMCVHLENSSLRIQEFIQ